MPVWVFIVIVVIASGIALYKRYQQRAVLNARARELGTTGAGSVLSRAPGSPSGLMSAASAAGHGLEATVYAPKDQVVAACLRAADFLGKSATTSATGASVTVRIRPGLVPGTSRVSPTVGIRLEPTSDGAVEVNAKVERYLTRQSRILWLIPFGPKRFVGRREYFDLLTSLQQELGSLVNGKGRVERIGA